MPFTVSTPMEFPPGLIVEPPNSPPMNLPGSLTFSLPSVSMPIASPEVIIEEDVREMAELIDAMESSPGAITEADAQEMVELLDRKRKSSESESTPIKRQRTDQAGPSHQQGGGPLDRAVDDAIDDHATVPNNPGMDLKLPKEFRVLSDTSYTVAKFRLTTRRLVVRSHGDVESFIRDLLAILNSQVDPEDRVAISVSSEEFPKEVCHVSFRRSKFLSPDVILKAIKAMMQSGSLNEHFLDMPVHIVFHRCEGVTGRGRGRSQRKGIQQMEVYKKNSKSIIIIRNDDNLCLARSLVVAIARKKCEEEPDNQELKKKYETVRDHRNKTQETAARELMRQAGVTEAECASSIDKFQSTVPYQIYVVEYDGRLPTLLYKGPELNVDGTARQPIFLLNSDDHFDVITKLNTLFGKEFFCLHCFKGYQRDGVHLCSAICKNCYASPPCQESTPRKCNKCLRSFANSVCFSNHLKPTVKGNTICKNKFICPKCSKFVNLTERKVKSHTCGEIFCTVCDLHVPQDHLCHIKPLKKEIHKAVPSRNTSSATKDTVIYIFYDIETVQTKEHAKGGLEHQPYLVVSQKACPVCFDVEQQICDSCGERERVFEGEGCITDFMTYVRSFHDYKEIICIAHNSKAYDAQWILRYMLDCQWDPEVLETGSKLMRIKYEKLLFLDSVNFIPLALSKFTSAFGLPPQSVKGHFPHFLFNIVDHAFDISRPLETNYTSSSLPPLDSYDPDSMSANDRAKFIAWYSDNKDQDFDFMREATTYCKMDVTVLRQGCSMYRKLYMERAQVVPFEVASTVAGTCMAIFKAHFLKEKQIGVIPAGGYRGRDRQSAVAVKYLAWIEHLLGRKLQSTINGREKRINGMKVDGYDEETRTVYEFHGCYYHGHTCIKDRNKTYTNDPHSTLHNRYESTLRKTEALRTAGDYSVVEKWECEFIKEMEENEELKNFDFQLDSKIQVLNPRDAFFGGRTETVQLYRKCAPGEKIFYQDFTSLYPWVNKNGHYPISHPTIYLGDDIPALEACEGLLKCTILPPKGLYLPVLPYRTGGKLYFPLCRSCAEEKPETCHHTVDERAITGTWVTCELQAAVRKGYIILKTFELWHYTKTTQYNKTTGEGGLFAGYVNMWLKIKQEASGWPRENMTENEKQAYIDAYKVNEGVDLDYNSITSNPGLRQIAKLSLNSLWGKLGQRPDLTKTEILNDAEKWFGLLYDPNIEVKSVLPINDDVVIAKWSYSAEVDHVQRSQNVVIAAYTTAMARLKLYSILEQLQQRVLYYDTDSVIYTCGPMEQPLPLGDYLGELTDEVSVYGTGAYISEFASGGPKNYGYLVSVNNREQETFKCKGIRLNHRNGSLVNFSTLKTQLGLTDHAAGPVTVTEPRGIVRYADHTVVSKPQTKTYRIVFDKRQRLPNFKTVPWGFCK